MIYAKKQRITVKHSLAGGRFENHVFVVEVVIDEAEIARTLGVKAARSPSGKITALGNNIIVTAVPYQ